MIVGDEAVLRGIEHQRSAQIVARRAGQFVGEVGMAHIQFKTEGGFDRLFEQWLGEQVQTLQAA